MYGQGLCLRRQTYVCQSVRSPSSYLLGAFIKQTMHFNKVINFNLMRKRYSLFESNRNQTKTKRTYVKEKVAWLDLWHHLTCGTKRMKGLIAKWAVMHKRRSHNFDPSRKHPTSSKPPHPRSS